MLKIEDEKDLKNLERYSRFILSKVVFQVTKLFTLYTGEIYDLTCEEKEEYIGTLVLKNSEGVKIKIKPYTCLGDKTFLEFYRYSSNSKELYEDDLMRKYLFVKEYIDMIISYRIEHSIDYVDDNLLLSFLRIFVWNNKEAILKNHQELELDKRIEVEKMLYDILTSLYEEEYGVTISIKTMDYNPKYLKLLNNEEK